MKKNRIAVVLIVLLGSASFWFIFNNGRSTIKETLRDFAVADTASVTKIFLADKSGKMVTLERTEKEGWTVNGQHKARLDVVKTLLETIKRVAVKEPVGKNAIDNVVKRLASKAIRCEIFHNGKLIKAYYVGSETQDLTGTYMILMNPKTMETSAKPFVTYIPGFEGYLTTRYFTEENGWRDRTVFSYNPNDIKKVKLESLEKPENSFELIVKGNNNYEVRVLKNNKLLSNIDTPSVKQYLSYFRQLNFESFEVSITQSQIDSMLKSKPIKILTITDNNGKENKTIFYNRWPRRHGLFDAEGKEIVYDTDRLDALLNNKKDFVMLQYLIFGKVLPPPAYFIKGPSSDRRNFLNRKIN